MIPSEIAIMRIAANLIVSLAVLVGGRVIYMFRPNFKLPETVNGN